VFQDHSRIVDVIAVDGKLRKGSQVGIVELWRPMASAEKPRRSPVAEAEALLQQPSLQAGDGERTQRQHRRQLQQFAPADLAEFLFIHLAIVYFAIVHFAISVLHELTYIDRKSVV